MINLGIDQAQYRLWSTRAVPHQLLPGSGLSLGISLGLLGAGTVFLIRIWWDTPLLSEIPLTHLAIVLATLPFLVHGLLLSGLSTLRGDITGMNIALLTGTLVYAVGIGTLFTLGRLTVEAALGVWALNATICWAVMLPRATRLGPLFPASIEVIRRQLLLGLKYAPYILFAFLILRIDVLFIAHLVGLEGVGLYSIAVLFPEMVWIITDSLAYPLAHKQANLVDGEAAGVTLLAIRVIVLLVVGLSTLIAVLAPWLIPFAYGNVFRAASSIVWALSPGILGMAVWRSLNPYLVRTRNPWLQPAIAGAALVTNVVLNLVLIPTWGLVGAAIASSVSYLVGASLAARVFLRNTDTRISSMVPARQDLLVLWGFARFSWRKVRAGTPN